MGWRFNAYPKGTVKQHLDSLMRSESGSYVTRVIASTLVDRRTYYAAVEHLDTTTGAREVSAAVVLVRYGRHEFGYNEVPESVGPSVAECPEQILELLTPTTQPFAAAWRQRCWDAIRTTAGKLFAPAGGPPLALA